MTSQQNGFIPTLDWIQSNMEGNKSTQNAHKIQVEELKKRIKFRKGREEDYLEVLALNRKVYGGYDYLPALYHKYIRDPFRWATITELDGKMASDN